MAADSTRSVPRRVWIACLFGYLAVGVTLVSAYYLVPPSGVGRPVRVVLYCLASASAAGAVLYGVMRNRPRPRSPWLFLAASQVVYATADTVFYVSHYLFDVTAYPSFSDPLYLAHYPLVVAGLTLLIRRRTPGHDMASLLDAAVLGVVAAMLSWLYLIAPQARGDSPLLVKMTSVTYPVMDLAMFAVALRLILGGGRRPASFFLLSTNLLAIFTADTIYVWQQLSGTYHTGNFLDAIWLGGNLALGAAALHPTVSQLGDRSPARDPSLGPARITALTGAALIAPATLLIQHARGELREVPAIAAACAVLFVLTIARLGSLVADQRRLAITDALTGLRTRRFFQSQLPVEVSRARRAGRPLAVFIIDVDHFKSINDRYGHPAGDRALIEIADRLKAASRTGDLLARYGGEEFALLVRDAEPEDLPTIAERLRQRVAHGAITLCPGSRVGVTVSVGTASYPLHTDNPSELVAAADRALYAAKARGRDSVVVGEAPGLLMDAVGDQISSAVDYLCHLADEVDARICPHEHSRAVGRWAMLVAAELDRDRVNPRVTGLAGRLHDIGKILVPGAVLAKPGALDEAEWQMVRQHPDHGSRLAAAVPGLEAVAEIIRQHHERFDGNGYPEGLAGTAIRPEARILAVCDCWAAMLADRPYQPGMTEEQAREELRRHRGCQFDPEIVDLFLDLHGRGRIDALARSGHQPLGCPSTNGRVTGGQPVVLGSGVPKPGRIADR